MCECFNSVAAAGGCAYKEAMRSGSGRGHSAVAQESRGAWVAQRGGDTRLAAAWRLARSSLRSSGSFSSTASSEW